GSPVAVIRPQKCRARDVMEKTSHDHFLVMAVLERQLGGAQQMRTRETQKAELEEIEQSRLLGHYWQSGILAHHEDGACLSHPLNERSLNVISGHTKQRDGLRHDQTLATGLRAVL